MRLAVCAVAVSTASMLAAAAAPAAPPSVVAYAHLRATGCRQVVEGSIVTVEGCRAAAASTGVLPGRLSLTYDAKVDLTVGSGTQRGTLTLIAAEGRGKLVARLTGTVDVATGASRGSWTATARTGAFRTLAGGSYVSHTPDHGVNLSFELRR